MATMVLESFMPARCWMAPEIPTATYSAGATILPVCPTCQSLGAYPASTAAREAPRAAPSFCANGSSSLKFSALPRPRPPDTTTRAPPSSGRSDTASSRLTKRARPASGTAATVSTGAPPPSAGAASKAGGRTGATTTG
ncbi:hypothetical protein G6F31_012550 [Rhizopus arrhizus]|nr:hypothetical protein G6F31_012550 [Rhizopus arrhizus]